MRSVVTVVTRNPAIAVGLTHHDYDVTDVRPDRLGDWTRQALGAQAVVLELSDPIAADAAIRRLRAEGNGVQVLVIRNNTDGWDEVLAHAGVGVRSLPLPITLPSLMAAVEELVAEGPVEVPPPPRDEHELLSVVAHQVGLRITLQGTVAPDPEAPAPPPSPLVEAPEPEVSPPVTPPAAAEPVVAEPRARAAAGLVAALTAAARDLTGVAETAEVVVEELADRVSAQAAALLLPDGEEWRVAGGVNLRPLEHRARLAADHWLVAQVALASQGVIVDDTDAAREALAGAPLASWKEVLAVPVEGVRGVFVAARGEEAFGEDSLRVAREVAEEAAPLLREALSVRVLARALAPYAELDD